MQWNGYNYGAEERDGKWFYYVEGHDEVGPFDNERNAMRHLEEWIDGQKTMKKIQAMLELNGVEVELTEEVKWEPGDPIENNAHMMLQRDFMDNASEEEIKKYYPDMFRAKNGTMRDRRYTAPELWPD